MLARDAQRRVFEGLSQEIVNACVRSLTDAAATITQREVRIVRAGAGVVTPDPPPSKARSCPHSRAFSV